MGEKSLCFGHVLSWFWKRSISLANYNSQSHTSKVWTSLKEMFWRCIFIYHLGQILAITWYDPIGTWTWVLGMSDQHTIHCSAVWVGKRWAPISPIAWYWNLCHCNESWWQIWEGQMLMVNKPKIYILFSGVMDSMLVWHAQDSGSSPNWVISSDGWYMTKII